MNKKKWLIVLSVIPMFIGGIGVILLDAPYFYYAAFITFLFAALVQVFRNRIIGR